MKYTTVNAKTGQRLAPLVPSVSDSAKISLFVHTLDIVIKTGRHFPVISIYLTGMNFLLAINDFLSNNIGFALLNSVFVVGGLIFAIQMRQVDKIHHVEIVPDKVGQM
jgi:hypothetical protein